MPQFGAYLRIVNYDRKTFIVEATGFVLLALETFISVIQSDNKSQYFECL
jgi:hypothetical protein